MSAPDSMIRDDSAAAERAAVDAVVERARVAQLRFEREADQALLDRAALAAAWALMEPDRNAALSQMAVEATGLGRVPDKIRKNHRKTLGLLRDIAGVATTGVVSDEPENGITELARPVGVVGAVVPSTNPAATPTNNVINALKCGNAIVLAPSPAGASVCEALISHIHNEFDRIGVDRDLVQMLPMPPSKVKTQQLMETVDLVIVTGSQDNVRRAYASGTPAIGVGAGNATVIVDETADLAAAANKIAASKTFDNATSCSSENQLIVVESVRGQLLDELYKAGGRLLGESDAARLKESLFQDGKLNRHLIAKDIDQFLEVSGVTVEDAESALFVLLEGQGVGPAYPESGEKLSLALTLFTVRDMASAMTLASELLTHQGAGHSVGIHTSDDSRAMDLAKYLPTCRVIVNQAHCFATGGSFDNGLPFSLSMGCGSWGCNSIDDNLNYTNFLNRTRVVRPIVAVEPALEDVFADYWRDSGQSS